MNYFYAQIDDNGICTGVTQAAGPIDASHMVAVGEFDSELLGYVYDAVTREFTAPPAPPPAPEDARLWWIDVGPFKDRLGMDAPAIYASNHDACKGVVGMVEGRKYINLRDPRIAGMMGVLIATSQPAANAVWPGSGPMTVAKRDSILTTPTTDEERHVKGLA